MRRRKERYLRLIQEVDAWRTLATDYFITHNSECRCRLCEEWITLERVAWERKVRDGR
jgi:hypothetical protein